MTALLIMVTTLDDHKALDNFLVNRVCPELSKTLRNSIELCVVIVTNAVSVLIYL